MVMGRWGPLSSPDPHTDIVNKATHSMPGIYQVRGDRTQNLVIALTVLLLAHATQ